MNHHPSTIAPSPPPALLALEDGTLFPGFSFGAAGTCTGEAVFNTSITGYQEVLTDPSYRGQLVTMTYPLQGNYGVNPEDRESIVRWATRHRKVPALDPGHVFPAG